MPQDRYTSDKLKTLKKIYTSYNLSCSISDLRKYEEWASINKEELPWKDRWHNMLLYTRSIINPNYTWKDISAHEQHTLIRTQDRATRCKCKICKDHYNPRGFMEYPCANYKAYIDIHGLFPEDPIDTTKNLTIEIEKDNIRPIKKSFWQRLLQKLRCY